MTRSVQADFAHSYGLPIGWDNKYMTTDDGRRVRYAYVPSLKVPPQGTITLVPGYRDPIDTYGPFVETLQRLGYEVFLMDWFGQGGSQRANPDDPRDPPSGHTERDVADLVAFEKIVARERQSNGIHVIIGHSNGGNILANFLKQPANQSLFDGTVFVDPLFEINRKALSNTFNLVARIMHAIGLGGEVIPTPKDEIDLFRHLMGIGEKIPDNAHRAHFQAVEANRPDLWIAETPTWEWYNNKRRSLDETRHGSFFKDIQTPMLMIAGSRDWLVDVGIVRSAARHAPNAKFVKIPGAGHNPLHDTDSADTAIGSIIGFMHALEKKIQPKAAHTRADNPHITAKGIEEFFGCAPTAA